MYAPAQRTYALALYSTMPFLGPIFGPLIGGTIARGVGWKLIFLVLFCISLFLASLAILVMRETYAPVLLRRRAARLHRESGGKKFFVSKYDVNRSLSLPILIRSHLSRPFVFLFTEPIVTLMAIYIAIEYAILYAMFAAFPIVFQVSFTLKSVPDISSRVFTAAPWIQSRPGRSRVSRRRCWRAVRARLYTAASTVVCASGRQEPWWQGTSGGVSVCYARAEHLLITLCTCLRRLLIVIVSAFSAPLGLFWFAWTANPKYHAMIPIAAVRLDRPCGVRAATDFRCRAHHSGSASFICSKVCSAT